LTATARAEVPHASAAQGREFRVDFSARHLDVDAELGELSLSGDVEVTVGRYRLGGQRVRLKRGPRGIGVEGGGDIAFCSCGKPPVTLGYSSVIIAPPSDVLIKHAVLRAGGVPLVWLPYLWLRSPDRLALIFPSAEWRGEDGLLLGTGVHVPFEANQGRPAERALDVGAMGYVRGGGRLDARLFTPDTTTFVRFDHRGQSALSVEAHGAIDAQKAAIFAYDVDASQGVRGRRSLSSLEAAARRYDHARFGVGSTGGLLLALGGRLDAPRGAWFSEPRQLGPFALLASGGDLGRRTSYSLDLAAVSTTQSSERRRGNAETRGLERLTLESSRSLGPLLGKLGVFEQGELVSEPAQALLQLRSGAGLSLSMPLVRRFDSFTHLVSPELTTRLERRWDGASASKVIATSGVTSALGAGPRAGALRLRVAAGLAGAPADVTPITIAALSADARLFGVRLSGAAEPRRRAAEASSRVRLGARGGTTLIGYAEARTEAAPSFTAAEGQVDVLPTFQDLGGYDRAGLSTGADLTLALASVFQVGGGADADPIDQKLLGVRAFARYRHACGCVALGAFGSKRTGRGGVDLGINLDFMP
jgi:hypothetical protein